MKKILLFGFALLLIGCSNTSSNASLEYGETGLPKNCRAIIKASVDGVANGEYEAMDALSSIDRNCGEFGYSW